MSDYVPNDRIQTSQWQDRLQPGNTVSFRFPVAEEAGGPEPKARPCLVLDTAEIDGVRHALLAYGTSRRTTANRGLEVEVRNVAARAAAGLDRRTRFVGTRRILVSLSDAGFVICAALETPILGRLAGGELVRLEKLRGEFEVDLGAAIVSPEAPRAPQTAGQEGGRRRRTWPQLLTVPRNGRTRGPVRTGQGVPA